jgi:uncharacterized protein
MNNNSEAKHVGRVVGLWRYPVKSMGAEALEAVDVSWFGLAGDRRWAFVRDDVPLSGFPWLTIRERSDMSRFCPSFADPSQPEKSATRVRTPSGDVMDISDPKLSAQLYPSGARLIKQNRGIFDTFPLSLITTQTIRALGDAVGAELDVQRFRPNLLIEAAEDTPYSEDDWVGHVLKIGGFRMRVDKRDGRCVVITVDPETGERSPAILKTVVRDREGCLGVYGTTVEPGSVATGDDVTIIMG